MCSTVYYHRHVNHVLSLSVSNALLKRKLPELRLLRNVTFLKVISLNDGVAHICMRGNEK